MAEEAGGRAQLEKTLEDWAITQDMLAVNDTGNAKWADADRMALALLENL